MQWYQDLKILKSSKSNVISCQDLEGQLKAARSALEAEREKRDFEYEIRMKLRDESDAKSVKIKGLQKDLQKTRVRADIERAATSERSESCRFQSESLMRRPGEP